MGYGFCRGCGKQILWIKTPAGKHMPCDPEVIFYTKDQKGDMTLVSKTGEVVRARRTTAESHDGIGYVSHYATCPKADQFRKK